jgi:Fic family protein
MRRLRARIDELAAALDTASQLPDAHVSKTQKVMYIVAATCSIFVEFLRIHPHANGNGHIARFIVISFLGRYELWPRQWPLDERPPDPPYSSLIKRYRDGRPDLLEQFVLKCILGIA